MFRTYPPVGANLILAGLLLGLPLLAESIAWARGIAPGVGLELIAYWPFDYGLLLFAALLFVLLNARAAVATGRRAWRGALFGGLVTLGWFSAAFLLVAQVHIARGGQL